MRISQKLTDGKSTYTVTTVALTDEKGKVKTFTPSQMRKLNVIALTADEVEINRLNDVIDAQAAQISKSSKAPGAKVAAKAPAASSKSRKTHKHLTASQKDEITRMVKRGASTKAISKKFDISQPSAWRQRQIAFTALGKLGKK